MLPHFCFLRFWNPFFFLPQKARVYARLVLFLIPKSVSLLDPSFFPFPKNAGFLDPSFSASTNARVFSTRLFLFLHEREVFLPILFPASSKTQIFLDPSFFCKNARFFDPFFFLLPKGAGFLDPSFSSNICCALLVLSFFTGNKTGCYPTFSFASAHRSTVFRHYFPCLFFTYSLRLWVLTGGASSSLNTVGFLKESYTDYLGEAVVWTVIC